MRKILYYLLILVISFSCKRREDKNYFPPKFKEIKEVSYNKINIDISLSNSGIFVSDSLFIFSDDIVENDCMFHLVNKQNGKYIRSFGTYGNGPGELMRPTTSYGLDINKRQLWAFNQNLPKMVYFSFGFKGDSLYINPITDTPVFTESRTCVESRKIKDDLYISSFVNIDGNKHRFAIGNCFDTLSTYDEYPRLEEDDGHLNIEKSFFLYRSYFALKPDGQKMVSATTFGGIMEIFDIKNNKIKRTVLKRFYKPVYYVKNRDSKIPYIHPTEKTIIGFSDLNCTDDAIYVILNPETKGSALNYICKFDWEGNPVCQYKLDKHVCSFDIDTKQNRVYALIENSSTLEEDLVWFDL